MLIKLGSAIQMKVQHLQLRGGIYQFYLRVTQSLIGHYGKKFIRQSLVTSDITVAAKQVEALARRYKAEFAVLSQDGELTDQGIDVAGQMLAQQYDMNVEHFIDRVLESARLKYANGDERIYQTTHPSEYLQ